MIPMEYVIETCKIGQGTDCCAFLMGGPSGMECAKGTSVEHTIRGRLQAGTMNARGDNCDGFQMKAIS
jgi:hypothetical protein